MAEQVRNRVVQVSRFGDPDALEVVDVPLPIAGRGEVRIRVLASSLNYTEVLIRRHLYPQTMRLRPPFVMGYDVVGDIDQIGDGVRDFQMGDRVADMTVIGSNADYRTLRAGDVARVPASVDVAEAATLNVELDDGVPAPAPSGPGAARPARARRRRRRRCWSARLVLGGLAGLELWGTRRAASRGLSCESLAQFRSTTNAMISRASCRVASTLVVDGVGEDGYRRSYAALKRGGLVMRHWFLGERPGTTAYAPYRDGGCAPVPVEAVARRQACLFLLGQCDASATSRLV